MPSIDQRLELAASTFESASRHAMRALAVIKAVRKVRHDRSKAFAVVGATDEDLREILQYLEEAIATLTDARARLIAVVREALDDEEPASAGH